MRPKISPSGKRPEVLVVSIISPFAAPLSRGSRLTLHCPFSARAMSPERMATSWVRTSRQATFSPTSRMVVTLEKTGPTSETMPTSPSAVITGSRTATPSRLPLSMEKE